MDEHLTRMHRHKMDVREPYGVKKLRTEGGTYKAVLGVGSACALNDYATNL